MKLGSRGIAARTLLAICVVVASPFFFSACQSLKDVLGSASTPSARITGARLDGLSLTSLTLVFDTEVSNPYSVPLPLANLEYSLASRGKQFLSGKAPVQGSIPAGESKVLPLPAEVSFEPMLRVLEGIRPGAVLPYEADLTLSVDAPAVGLIALPIRHSGEIPVPAPPSVELGQIEWKNLSLESATAVLHLSVVNTNSFPLSLEKLSFGLSLGNSHVGQAGLEQAAKLDAGANVGLQVPLSISPKDLGLGAFQLLTGEGAGYKLDGAISVGTPFGPMSIPLTQSGKTKFIR